MVAELGIRIHDSSNSSILIHGDVLYACTANGVNEEHETVAEPDAPTLIALNKQTGKLVARDDFGVGSDVVHGQWSSPVSLSRDLSIRSQVKDQGLWSQRTVPKQATVLKWAIHFEQPFIPDSSRQFTYLFDNTIFI